MAARSAVELPQDSEYGYSWPILDAYTDDVVIPMHLRKYPNYMSGVLKVNRWASVMVREVTY